MVSSTVAFFWCLHDVAKLLEQGEPHHLIPSRRQPRSTTKLSLGQMLSILVLFHISADKDFKHVWHYGLRHEYRACFAELPRCSPGW